jgi:hypothetical protein
MQLKINNIKYILVRKILYDEDVGVEPQFMYIVEFAPSERRICQ